MTSSGRACRLASRAKGICVQPTPQEILSGLEVFLITSIDIKKRSRASDLLQGLQSIPPDAPLHPLMCVSPASISLGRILMR